MQMSETGPSTIARAIPAGEHGKANAPTTVGIEASERWPRVGDTVHYVSYGTPGGEFGQECRAAIITEVPEMVTGATPSVVGLCVLNPLGDFFHPLAAGGCGLDERTKKGGTWHWRAGCPR